MTFDFSDHELHHEIFGSILDRVELRPYLLKSAVDYASALRQAAKMMANRGFDVLDASDLPASEKKRAIDLIEQAREYYHYWMQPFMLAQFRKLAALNSPACQLYQACLDAMAFIDRTLADEKFLALIEQDPRHLLLMASSHKYPEIFKGYQGEDLYVPAAWQQMACALLKIIHLIKSVEEDSQDINDFAQLGFFLEQNQQNLDNLFNFGWENPQTLPKNEAALQAFVKISSFFHKLNQSLSKNPASEGLVFDSGDGVKVEILEIKARLKSPESMFTKLGKDLEGESFDIRDILALTFILRDKHDTLKLFHALQKRGVILQENTASQSITQTLFDNPEQMTEAVRRLMQSLAQSAGYQMEVDAHELTENCAAFYTALSMNASKNHHSSQGHRKFQCKLAYSVPLHRSAATREILVPGTSAFAMRHQSPLITQQHSLGVELRISDIESWRSSEQIGDSHHNAYKFRQLLAVMNRVFKANFHFPPEALAKLRADQERIFT